MSLKKWLQKNAVFDKDLLTLFPKYGVNDPEKDLKNLKPEQWKEIQETIKNDRAKELKDNAAKLRLQKKLTKVEKLWKAKRPKKKVKEPKLLKLFDDEPPKESNGSSTPKTPKKDKKKKTKSTKKKNTKKNGSKPSSPKKSKGDKDKDTKDTKKDGDKASKSKDTKDKSTKKAKSKDKDSNDKDTKAATKTDTDNNNKETASKETNGAKPDDKAPEDKPPLVERYSSSDIIAAAGEIKFAVKEAEPEQKETETEPKKEENWDQYDNLRISDNEEEPTENGGTYNIPTLGKQESVVDALMSGPYGPGDKSEESKDTEKDKEDEDKDKEVEPEEAAIDFTSTDLEKEKSDATISVSQGTISHSVSTAAVMGDDEEWDRYDDLRISDEDNDGDEVKEPEKTNTPGLYVPLVPLKTQGSVVDMLMDGPVSKPKPKSAFISVTPPAPEDDVPTPEDIQKDYSITVSHGSKTEIKVDGSLGKDVKEKQEQNGKADEVEDKLNKILDKDDKEESNGYVKTKEATRISKDEDDTLTVTYFKAEPTNTTTENKENVDEDDNVERKTISLSADAFVYNENTNSYTVSLSSARLLRSDFIKGMITFEINGKRVDKDKSDEADKQMDDNYIDSVLDEIERDNPDSDQD